MIERCGEHPNQRAGAVDDRDDIAFADSAGGLGQLYEDGIAWRDGNVIAIADNARPLVRAAAAAFDQYLGETPARHSRAV